VGVADSRSGRRYLSQPEGGPKLGDRRSPWIQAVKLVAFSRIVYFVVAYLAISFLASTEGSSSVGVLEMWTRWDAAHFLQVAEFGYTDLRSDPHATAFFPLFPLLVRALSSIGIAPELAGLMIAAAASVVAVAYLYRLAEDELGGDAGRRAALYLLFFPTAVFLVAPYSEALFLAGAIPAFYYARRGRWLAAGAFAAVSMGARAAGGFLLVGLLFEFLRRRDFRRVSVMRALGGGAVALLPLLAFGVYLAQIKGDPLYFFTDQRLGWGRELSSPVEALSNTWNATRSAASEGSLTNFIIGWRVEIVAAMTGLGAVGWALIKREWGYAAFMGTLLAALMTSTIYLSIPRMLLTMFPIVLFVAAWTRSDRRRHEWVLLAFASIAMLGTVVFVRQSWFF
jgi:hypothetical protein